MRRGATLTVAVSHPRFAPGPSHSRAESSGKPHLLACDGVRRPRRTRRTRASHPPVALSAGRPQNAWRFGPWRGGGAPPPPPPPAGVAFFFFGASRGAPHQPRTHHPPPR